LQFLAIFGGQCGDVFFFEDFCVLWGVLMMESRRKDVLATLFLIYSTLRLFKVYSEGLFYLTHSSGKWNRETDPFFLPSGELS
jgi:hypothetical protein